MSFLNLFLLVLSVLVWGFIHSLTASHPFKAFVRRIAGTRADRYYRLAYNAVSILTLLIVLIIAILTPDRTLYVVPFPWVAILIVVEMLAVAALIIGFLQTDALEFLGVRQVTAAGDRKQATRLVKDGLYSYVRHPLYAAGLLFIWALPLMTARVLVINLALTVYVVVGAYFEERKLRQKFGVEYSRYSAVTPMFIPFLKKIRLQSLLHLRGGGRSA